MTTSNSSRCHRYALPTLAAALATASLLSGCGGSSADEPVVGDFQRPAEVVRGSASDISDQLARFRETAVGEAMIAALRREGDPDVAEGLAIAESLADAAFTVTAATDGPAPVVVHAAYTGEPSALDRWWALIGGGDGDTFEDGSVTVERAAEDEIRLAMGGAPQEVVATDHGHDLLVSWNADQIRKLTLDQLPSDARPAAERLPSGHYLLDIEDGAFVERFLFDAQIGGSGLRAIDAAVVDDVPEQALVALAVGLDLPALITSIGDPGKAFTSELADELRRGGVDAEVDQILSDLSGTWLIWIAPGAPFPTVGVQLPDGPGVQALLAAVAAEMGIEVPAEGSSMPVPPQLTDGLPVPLTLAHRAGAWLLTSNQVIVADWLAGSGIGGPEGALHAHFADGVDQEALILGGSNTPALAAFAKGYLGMLGNVAPPEVTEQVGSALDALQGAAPGSLIVVDTDGGSRITMRGQLPAVAAIGVAAGLALPAIGMARSRAQRAMVANNMRQILLASLAYKTDHDEVWPPDMATLSEWAEGELVEPLFLVEGAEDVPQPHILYVRPGPVAEVQQPVFVQHPDTSRDGSIVVAFADGQTENYEGHRANEIATTARRLRRSIEQGEREWATTEDWQGVIPELRP